MFQNLIAGIRNEGNRDSVLALSLRIRIGFGIGIESESNRNRIGIGVRSKREPTSESEALRRVVWGQANKRSRKERDQVLAALFVEHKLGSVGHLPLSEESAGRLSGQARDRLQEQNHNLAQMRVGGRVPGVVGVGLVGYVDSMLAAGCIGLYGVEGSVFFFFFFFFDVFNLAYRNVRYEVS